MNCEHELAEKETACYADSLCPICLLAENKRLKKAIKDFGNNPAGFDWAVLDRIEKLEKRGAVLNALEAAGVNNWEGYDEAIDILKENDETTTTTTSGN